MPISRENYLSLCRYCYESLHYIYESCPICGRFGEGRSMCTDCADETYHFDRVYSVLGYNDFMHRQLYGYKYGHRSYLGRIFGELLRDFIRENELSFDFATAVPISERRLGERGFNQSEQMAQAAAGERYRALFVRKKHTAFLSDLSKAARINELTDAFDIDEAVLSEMLERHYAHTLIGRASERQENAQKKDEPSEPKLRLLIIDDILTTGSTLNELAGLAKKKIHSVEIVGLTLCNARR